MPRRKSNEAPKEVRRSTRGSIGKAEEEAKDEKTTPTRTPRKARSAKALYISPESSPQSSPSPSPPKSRRGRPRGSTGRAATSRARDEDEVIELSDQDDEEPQDDDDEFVPSASKKSRGRGTPAKRGAGKKSPRASVGTSPGRGRGRPSKAGSQEKKKAPRRRKKMDEDSEDEGEWRSDEEDVPVVASPARSQRSRRSAQPAADVGSPPRRSSSRAAAKAASASIEAQVAEEGSEVVDLDETSTASKRENEGEDKIEEPAEKRAKVEDEEEEEEEEVKTDEEMPAAADDDDVATSKSDAEEVDGGKKEEKLEEKAEDDKEVTDKVEDEAMEVDGAAAVEEKEEEKEMEEKEEDVEPEEEKEEEDSKKTDVEESTKVDEQKEEGIEEDYVMIDKADVPSPQSADVIESIPKEKQANGENIDMDETEDSSVKPNEEPVSVEPEVSSEEKTADTQTTTLPPCNSNGPTQNSNPQAGTSLNCGDNNKSQCSNSSPLFSRSLITNPTAGPKDADKTFSVVSYNILADCHAQRDYTSEGVWITKEHLALTYRHELIVKELKYLDADVICLQEVGPDHFNNLLLPSLQELGYEGAMIKRTDSVHNEGEATFYRTSRFDLLSNKPVALATLAKKDLDSSGLEADVLSAVKSAVDTPAVAMITQLKCLRSGSTVTVANIHNMWDRFARQDLQCIMVSCAIRELVNLAGGPDQPHVICGDFNSEPDSCVYQLTKEGYLNDASMSDLNKAPSISVSEGKDDAPLVNLWWRGFQHTSSLKSAYATVLGREPLTSKFPHDGITRAVDFIWYAGTEARAVLATSPSELIEAGVPNSIFPSDHLSTKALLAFK